MMSQILVKREGRWSMYKTDVVKRVARETRLSQKIVSDVLDASQRLIEEALRAGETVVFPGFGKFATSRRQAGKVRHIRTGKIVEYPARTVAVFKVGEYLRRAVAGKRRR
jgi:DNA-binding protein HU-beta